MSLRAVRIKRNMTQKRLADQSGVNFRSLQDYEQGHKRLASASADTLLRISTVLGCSVEDLLMEEEWGARLLPENDMSKDEIHGQIIYCEPYGVYGRWVCSDTSVATVFYYDGKLYKLPLLAIFRKELLPLLKDAASLQIESKIEEILFEKQGLESW